MRRRVSALCLLLVLFAGGNPASAAEPKPSTSAKAKRSPAQASPAPPKTTTPAPPPSSQGPVERWRDAVSYGGGLFFFQHLWLPGSLVIGLVLAIRNRGRGFKLFLQNLFTPVVAAFVVGTSYILAGWPESALGMAAFQVVLTFIGYQALRGWYRAPAATMHGSATWGTLHDLRKRGRIQKRGFVLADSWGFALGRVQAKRREDPRLRYMGHVLTCAPTGAGKGVGAVIPTLLEYPGSVFVLDVKGENYAVTAKARASLGQRVVLLDPFGVTGVPSNAINWLDGLDLAKPDTVSASAALSDLLVVADGTHDSYWDDAARDLLRGLILYAVRPDAPQETRNIGEVRRMLVSGEDELHAVLAGMLATQSPGDVVARAAHTFLAKADKEASGVLSSAARHTAFLDDPRVVECVSRSDFRWSDLKTSALAAYLVIPPDKISAYARLLRGCVGTALAAMTATPQPPKFRVAFILDEFAALGRMQIVEDAIALLRGYGVALWLFVQDLSQLRKVYPKADSLLANTAKQFWCTADLETAKYVSGMLGQTTVTFQSQSQGTDHMGKRSQSTSTQYTGRPLLTPDEVMRLGALPLVLISGEPPYLAGLPNYLRDPEYAGKASPNPYHAS